MNVDNELKDFDAAGALAEELPWWGWLEDGRSCLTRAGELMAIASLTPSVLDGQTPEQQDRVVDRWQRMLSGVDSRTRLYFYLLRRPIQFENQGEDEGSSVAALGRRKRRAFLEKRVQSVSAYVAWAHDPGLSAVATQKTGGPWWMAYAKNWMARRRNQHESVYLESAIAAAAGSFRQLVEASRALVDDLTPLRVLDAGQASLVLNELTNRPGSFWDGATGSGMNWRLAVSELEAERRNLRLDGEPVILYSLLSPPGAAKANLLQELYRLDATMTVTLEWRPQGLDTAPPQNPGSATPLLLKALLYVRRRPRNRRHRYGHGGHGGGGGIRPARRCSGRVGDGRHRLRRSCPDRGAPRPAIRYREHRRRYPAHLYQPRRQGDPGGLRAASGVVFADARATATAAMPIRVCIGGRGCYDGSDLRSSGGNTAQRPLEESGPGRSLKPNGEPPTTTICSKATWDIRWCLARPARGKSFALNFLLVQALQYDPRILILDLGGSYRWLTQFLGGGYMELSPEGDTGGGFQLTALLASSGGADLRIPCRVDCAAVANRRLDTRRGRP